MAEVDRERCLEELRRHETEITSLSLTLAELDCTPVHAARGAAPMSVDRHIAYINAQMMRHRISVALLESRLGAPPQRRS